MNSIAARNLALLLILSLLLYVFNGISANQLQSSRQRGDNKLTHIVKPKPTSTPAVASAERRTNQPASAEAVEQVMRTGRLPATKIGQEGRKLSLEELEEVAATAQLPQK
jgi:hypothetical protein